MLKPNGAGAGGLRGFISTTGESTMSDAVLLYLFIFLMFTNFMISLFYAIGSKQMRAAVKKAFRENRF